MAKGLLFNLPAHGHINPSLPLTEELVRQGETIIYYTSENQRAKITPTGAEFRTLPYELNWDAKVTRSPYVDVQLFDCTLKCMPQLIEEAKQDKPDYIIHDFVCYWGKILAEQIGVPRITLYPNPVPDISALPPKFIFTLLDTLIPTGRVAKRMREEIATRYRRAPETLIDFLTRDHGDLGIVLTSEVFQPNHAALGPSFKFVGPVIPKLPDSPAFPLAQLEGKKVIYISLGTVHGDNRGFFTKCMRAFRGTEYTVVMSTGNALEPESFAEVPPNFIIRKFVPQSEILDRACLFITHGGMNSIHGGIYHGVPMIVIPQGIGTDQKGNARTVERKGTGVCFTNPLFRPATLLKSVERLLGDPGLPTRLKVWRDEFRQSTAAVSGAREIINFTRQTTGLLK